VVAAAGAAEPGNFGASLDVVMRRARGLGLMVTLSVIGPQSLRRHSAPRDDTFQREITFAYDACEVGISSRDLFSAHPQRDAEGLVVQ
jgi:hypothetical protein